MREIAKAEQDVQLTNIDTEKRVALGLVEAQELLVRAGARVRNIEMLKQKNIEEAATEAIEILNNEEKESEAEPVDDDWLLIWIEGVQWISNESITKIYARVLANKTLRERNHASAASLRLLKDLDAETAELFLRFCEFRMGVIHSTPG